MSPSRSKAAGLSDSDNSENEEEPTYAVEDTQGVALAQHHGGSEERRGLWTPEV